MAGASTTKPKRPVHLGEVREARRLTPGMIRLVLGGPGLTRFEAGEFTDHYVKVQLPPPGAPYTAPFDPERIKAEQPREMWPRTRSITVRRWDPANGQLTLDFVDHGPAGFAGPWAASAGTGDRLQLLGPGGSYAPDPEADWHLMAGDAAAIPAIAVALERMPAGVPVVALLAIKDRSERLELASDGDLDRRWVEPVRLAEAVGALDLPAGRGQAFVHGEAGMVREVRRHLIAERGFPREALSASGYWKRDRTDEDWRAEKPEWKRLAEADIANV